MRKIENSAYKKEITAIEINSIFLNCGNHRFQYVTEVWNSAIHKNAVWKDEIQKIQNTGLRKILGAFRSAPIKAMQRDSEVLPVIIRMKEIPDRFAIRAIRAVSPRNLVWKLANSSKLAKGDLEKLFARVK